MINRRTIWAFLAMGVALVAIFIVVAVAPGSYVLAQDSDTNGADVIPREPVFDARAVAAPLINDATGLQFGASDLEVVGVSQVNWPDTCLGLAVSGMPPFEPDLCEQSVVPGYRIVVTALDGTYVVHTNRDGSEARLLPPTIALGEGGAQAGVPVTGEEAQQATATPAADQQATATPAADQQATATVEATAEPAATATPEAAAEQTATPAVDQTATPAADQQATPAAEQTATPATGDQQATPAATPEGEVPVTGDQPQVVPGAGLPSIPGEPAFNVESAIIPALNDVSGLNYSADDLRIVSVQRVNFSDDCLGLPAHGLPPFDQGACAVEANTGYRIGVVAIDAFYVVHTNEDGSEVRVVPPTITAGTVPGVPVTGEEGQPAGGAYAGMLNLYRPEQIPAQPTWNVLSETIGFLSDELDLQLNREVVEITSVQRTTWTDACLGLAGIDGGGMSCAPIATRGYRIVANVIDGPYVIHTNADGSDMRLVPPGLTAGTNQQAGEGQNGE